MLCVQKALAEVKVFKEKGELPKDMNEKPPLPDSQEESEGEEEEEEEEEREVSEERFVGVCAHYPVTC